MMNLKVLNFRSNFIEDDSEYDDSQEDDLDFDDSSWKVRRGAVKFMSLILRVKDLETKKKFVVATFDILMSLVKFKDKYVQGYVLDYFLKVRILMETFIQKRQRTLLKPLIFFSLKYINFNPNILAL